MRRGKSGDCRRTELETALRGLATDSLHVCKRACPDTYQLVVPFVLILARCRAFRAIIVRMCMQIPENNCEREQGGSPVLPALRLRSAA